MSATTTWPAITLATRCDSPRRTLTSTVGAPRPSPPRRCTRCAPRSPITCGRPRAAAPSWCNAPRDTSTPATHVNPTTPTGTEPRMLTLTLDIGGTKIAAGLVDPSGALVHAATRPTPKNRGAEQVWAVIQQMIADATQAAGGPIRGV